MIRRGISATRVFIPGKRKNTLYLKCRFKKLKTEIDRYLNRHYGISYDVDHEIMVTIGGSEAIDAAMRAMLDPGDEVLIPQFESNHGAEWSQAIVDSLNK